MKKGNLRKLCAAVTALGVLSASSGAFALTVSDVTYDSDTNTLSFNYSGASENDSTFLVYQTDALVNAFENGTDYANQPILAVDQEDTGLTEGTKELKLSAAAETANYAVLGMGGYGIDTPAVTGVTLNEVVVAKTVKEYDTSSWSKTVLLGTPQSELDLPTEVSVTFTDETTGTLKITGWSDNYDPNSATTQLLAATVDLAGNNDGGIDAPEYTVVVSKEVTVTEVDAASVPSTVNTITGGADVDADAVSKQLPQSVKIIGSEPAVTDKYLPITWEYTGDAFSGMDYTNPQEFTGTVGTTSTADPADGLVFIVTAIDPFVVNVTLQDPAVTYPITSVGTLADLNLAATDTLTVEAVKAKLASTYPNIQVTADTAPEGSKTGTVKLDWTASTPDPDADPLVAGNTYTFTAALDTTGSIYTNDSNLTASVKVVVAPEEEEIVYGDLDEDGSITMQDANRAARIFGEKDQATSDMLKVADVDGDGTVTMQDVNLIARVFGEKDDSFPVENE